MSLWYLDTETCGFHGVPVLMQYAVDDGPVMLHDIWLRPAQETLDLIEKMTQHTVVGFNLVFDWFHIQKIHAMLSRLPDKSVWPEEVIDELAEIEPLARDCLCVKPAGAFDVMLHARKGPYQSTMDRHDIRIKKVPTQLAWVLAAELDKRIPIPDIYFARRKDQKRFEVRDRVNDFGRVDPAFKDIVLSFAPSSALKALASDALGVDVLHYGEVEIDPKYLPEEVGYAPFAKALSEGPFWIAEEVIDDDDLVVKLKKSGLTWPGVIRYHIEHWFSMEKARKYATDDIVFLRDLYHYFGDPSVDDDDSVLACNVASARWRGYCVEVEKLKRIVKKLEKEADQAPRDPKAALPYITQHMTEVEAAIMTSTKRALLEQVENWTTADGKQAHPAAIAARAVLHARQSKYNLDILRKIVRAGRFHASASVIGTLSGRMGGGGGDLNAHGITKRDDIRECFLFAYPGEHLNGGDYDAFEITIAIAVYNDEGLTNEVKSGKKIHGIFGTFLFPGHTYEQIKATDGTDNDLYRKSKSAVFSQLFGGDAGTINRRLGIPIEQAEAAQREFARRYPGVGRARQRIIDMFGTIRQHGGIGSKITWTDPADYMETLFGFRRYFTLENRISRELFNLAQNPPKEWQQLKIRVVRRDRIQTAAGATQSALYGAAFAIQSSVVRAAANHEIQGTGAAATKRVQRRVWDLQPPGVHPWVVMPFNMHDELMVPTAIEYDKKVEQVVNETVEEIRKTIPLVSLKWITGLKIMGREVMDQQEFAFHETENDRRRQFDQWNEFVQRFGMQALDYKGEDDDVIAWRNLAEPIVRRAIYVRGLLSEEAWHRYETVFKGTPFAEVKEWRRVLHQLRGVWGKRPKSLRKKRVKGNAKAHTSGTEARDNGVHAEHTRNLEGHS